MPFFKLHNMFKNIVQIIVVIVFIIIIGSIVKSVDKNPDAIWIFVVAIVIMVLTRKLRIL